MKKSERSRRTLIAMIVVGGMLVFAAIGGCAQVEPMQGPTNAPGSHQQEHPRIVTMTRTARTFGDLEQQLFDAVKAHDAATLDKLLAPDFELRRADNPGTPVPRAEVMKEKTTDFVLHHFRISDVAVHEYGADVAVVSFHYADEATKNMKDVSGNYMMVDVWARSGGEWKLAVRYASPSTKREPVRPTGKQ